MLVSHLAARIDAPGPKKILALDGGGIRGVITIEFLCRLEALLRERLGRPDLVLADYFDYVGGTSTGAIIATLVSLGYATDAIRTFYETGARTMFDPANRLLQWARQVTPGSLVAKVLSITGMLRSSSLFTQKALENEIKTVLGTEDGEDLTLGTGKLRTLLNIVTRNATTDSPWPLCNNPRAKYNLPENGKLSNLLFPLWKLVRASTAAPIFFPPEVIDLGGERPNIFVDGGVTVYNNPAFLFLLMATLEPYNVGWKATQDDLLVVSVGTGMRDLANAKLTTKEMNLMYSVRAMPEALIKSATVEQDLLCRVFGSQRVAEDVDSEIGNLVGLCNPLEKKLFTYVRYNVDLTDKACEALGCGHIDASQIQQLDDINHVQQLRELGAAAAQRFVVLDDLTAFLSD